MFALALAFSATGCSAAKTSAEGAPSSIPSSVPTTTPSAESTVAPVTDAPSAAAELSCETVLTPAGYAQLETDGLTLREASGGSSDISALIVAANGLFCTWARPSTDILAAVGIAPLDEAMWESARTQLIEAGFSPDDSTFSGFLTAPPTGQDLPTGGVVYADGRIYYVSAPQLLDWIPALQS